MKKYNTVSNRQELTEEYITNLRNQDILKKRQEGWKLKDIGFLYGLTRERVRQILTLLNKEGEITEEAK